MQLVGPTVFPAPPAGTTGPILFPYDIAVAVTSGGTATGGQGNDVVVTLPSYGLVAPSTDWNGAPHSFFNDASCTPPNNGGGGTNNGSDCYRWEEYAGPIFPGSTTGASSVGFDLDPTVGQFTARLIVAADLQNSGPAPTGTVAGSVTSPQLGALNGVTVTATSGITSLPGTTAGAGAYSIASVPTGPASVAITGGLPAGCTNPGSQATTVTNGSTSTVNFTVTCPVPVGSVAGQITFTGFTPAGAAIDAITVSATPTGGSAVSGNVTSTGAIAISPVPVGVGTGSVTLGSLPAGCTAVPAGSYSGLTNGGSVTVNFTVPCVAPPSLYQYTGTAVDNGAAVTITFSINMSTRDDAAIPGADDIFAIQGSFTYNAARLSAPSCTNVAGSGLTNATPNVATPGVIGFGNFSTNPAVQTGTQGIIACTFTDAGTGALTTATTITVAESQNGTNLQPNIQINDVP